MIVASLIRKSMTPSVMLDPDQWHVVKARLNEIERLIMTVDDASHQSLLLDMVVRLRTMLIDVRCEFPRYKPDEVRGFYDATLMVLHSFGVRD